MLRTLVRTVSLASVLVVFGATSHAAVSDAVKCEAARLKLAGKHASCTLKAEATALLKSTTPDFAACVTKYDAKCAAIATKYGAACPLSGDCASIRDAAECASDSLPIPTTTTTTTTTLACGAGPDEDGDGFTVVGGDCADCDALVNPGALEIANGVDDDCDGNIDNVAGPCDSALALADTDPMNAARAIDLCQQTTAMGTGWGVISAAYKRSNGAPAVPTTNVGLMDSFGVNVPPLVGARLLVLSSGRARTVGQPSACGAVTCSELGAGTAPAGFPQTYPSCPPGASVNDDVALELTLRVPTNAVGYRFRFNFYAFDYPAFVCTAFNDQYATIVSPAPAGSTDGNITFDTMGGPVSVNSPLAVCVGCPNGTAELTDTGFDVWGAQPAAATSWLLNQAPATGGSTIVLRFAIFDVGDTSFDSTVLLDGFEWITSGTPSVGTTPVP